MGKNGRVKMKILTMFAIVVFIVGCSGVEVAEKEFEIPQKPSSQISKTEYFCGWLLTIEHDDHLFVVEGRYQKGAIIHHPDCPCGWMKKSN